MSEARRITAAACPDEEMLIAHLTGSLADADAVPVDDHCCACDACAMMLLTACSRLRVATALTSVPDAVQRKALAACVVPASAAAPATARPSASARLGRLLRLPVLMPLSFAAGVLLMVGLHRWPLQSSPQPRLRSVPEAGVVIVAPGTAVYALPDVHAHVLATLSQGTAVQVVAEQRDWYRIVLPERSTGWVLQKGVQLR